MNKKTLVKTESVAATNRHSGQEGTQEAAETANSKQSADPKRCKAEVWVKTKWFRGYRRAVYRQCDRHRGHGEGGEYCSEHTGGTKLYGAVNPPPNQLFPGQPEDVTRCSESIDGGVKRASNGKFYCIDRQCPNKRGHGDDGKYCRRHAEARDDAAAERVLGRKLARLNRMSAMARTVASASPQADQEPEQAMTVPDDVQVSEQGTPTDAEREGSDLADQQARLDVSLHRVQADYEQEYEDRQALGDLDDADEMQF